MVEGKVETLVDDMDHSYGIESAVETYFSNSFSLDDHVDIDDAVRDAVDDKIDDAVSDKIDDAVEGYMSNATITISK